MNSRREKNAHTNWGRGHKCNEKILIELVELGWFLLWRCHSAQLELMWVKNQVFFVHVRVCIVLKHLLFNHFFFIFRLPVCISMSLSLCCCTCRVSSCFVSPGTLLFACFEPGWANQRVIHGATWLKRSRHIQCCVVAFCHHYYFICRCLCVLVRAWDNVCTHMHVVRAVLKRCCREKSIHIPL